LGDRKCKCLRFDLTYHQNIHAGYSKRILKIILR
jgi:hypothetical protein